MSLRSAFKTSKQLETQGIELEYGQTVIRARRAGGSNKRYQAKLAKALKPYGGALTAGVATDEQVLKVSIPVFVEEVILGWFTWIDSPEEKEEDGTPKRVLVSGVEGVEPNTVVPATTENMVAFFEEVPEFFERVHADAKGRQYFLDSMEAAAGN